METLLRMKLLGNPAIYLNQEEVFFSFAKIHALLFYLCVKGSVSREEIAGILWENKDNQTAKKNLRNTIYQANKVLGLDVIVAPNRTVLSLNPDLKIVSDIEEFSAHPAEKLSLYQGDFLQGFYLKDGEGFDFWVSKMRSHYQQLYIQACYQKIESQMGQDDFEEIELNLRRLIELDEFEEKNYQLLMKLYQENNRSGKVIEVYYKLVNLLDKELGISPNDQIQQIYHEVIAKDRNERKTQRFLRTTHHFFGRVDEIKRLEAYFSQVLGQQEARALMLVGGTGIGKRTVTRQVLANQARYFQIVTAECFREDAVSPLQVWRSILDGLGDLVIQHQIVSLQQWTTLLELYFPLLDREGAGEAVSPDRLSQFIVDILQKISKKKALVLLIEDCHWMDKESVALLESVLNHLTDYPVAFVLTKHLSTPPALEHFLNHLLSQDKIDFIQLQPLSQADSRAYLEQELGAGKLSDSAFAEIYHISQGNPFLLSEYAQELGRGEKFAPLTPAVRAKMALKLEGLSSREEELIHYLACFRGQASLQILAKLMVLSHDELVEIVEGLCQRQILLETYQEDELVVQFSQRILQLYSYENLSLAKRRILHNHIAQVLEEMLEDLQSPSQLLHEIAYHYKMSRQVIQSLDYSLNYLEATLQFHHELFPIYSQKFGFINRREEESPSLLQEEFETIRRSIAELEKKYENRKDFQRLVLRFLYLEGRYHIRTGNYQQGIHHIQRVIASARELHDMTYLLAGYRQIIHYCIQAENIPEMKYYIGLALEASVQDNNHEAIAINLRLNGLYHLMTGDRKKAVQLINQSIDCFSLTASLRSKYSIQIAAALDYLAEIEQLDGDFQQAISYQKEAIELTESKTDEPSIVVFYIGLGMSYYLSGDREEAEKVFLSAKEASQSLRFPWKEVQLEVYLALIHADKGNYQPVLELLGKKEELIDRYSSPRDKGLLYYLMAVLKFRLQSGQLVNQEMAAALSSSFEAYYEVAVQHLNTYRDSHQLRDLEELRKELAN